MIFSLRYHKQTYFYALAGAQPDFSKVMGRQVGAGAVEEGWPLLKMAPFHRSCAMCHFIAGAQGDGFLTEGA